MVLKGDVSTTSMFCCENSWWESLVFQLYNAPINCYNFTSEFMLDQ